MTDLPLRITVLAALGRNPVSGAVRPNRDDLLALEIARRLKGEITLLHAGDAAEPALADYFAYGAAGLEVVPLAGGGDIVAALAGRLPPSDLILAGSRAEGGEGSGLVPYLLAERLGLPIVAGALDLTVADGSAEVTQFLPRGQRRRLTVRLPAVIAVHPMAAACPRYAYARRVAGRLTTQPPAAATVPRADSWRVEAATRKPVRLKARETKAGHDRMLSAIVTEARGGVVVDTGTPAEQAQAIIAYLREHRLIDW